MSWLYALIFFRLNDEKLFQKSRILLTKLLSSIEAPVGDAISTHILATYSTLNSSQDKHFSSGVLSIVSSIFSALDLNSKVLEKDGASMLRQIVLEFSDLNLSFNGGTSNLEELLAILINKVKQTHIPK